MKRLTSKWASPTGITFNLSQPMEMPNTDQSQTTAALGSTASLGWVSVSDRMPAEQDSLHGNIWWANPDFPECVQEDGWQHPENSTHWMTPRDDIRAQDVHLPDTKISHAEDVALNRGGA